MIRFLLPVSGLALVLVVLAAGLTRDPTLVPSPLLGKPVPAFDLPDLEVPARRVRDTDLRGGVTLLNAWATWCVACRQEHPVLNAIAAGGDVAVYGLNYKDEPDQARDWLARLGNPYRASGVDADGRVGIDLGVYGLPETFVIDRSGTIVYKHVGPLTEDVWARHILPLVRELQGR